MLNCVTLLGRLVKDPEVRTTNNGTSVASFTLAVDRDYSSNGNRETDFVDCVAWKSGADFVSKYFHRGQMMGLKGRLQSRKWEDRDGNKRIAWEVVADNMYFGGDKSSSEDRPVTKGVNVSATAFEDLDDDGGDLPF